MAVRKTKTMATGRSQFVGAAGQYFVSYGLAVRQIHASLTVGNAPSVDILAASALGQNSLSIQVKTSRNAYRGCRYGREGHEWDVGTSVIDKCHVNLWFALVDLREGDSCWNPEVFFVPSFWVGQFVKQDFSRKLYFLPSTADDISKERWDYVSRYLSGDLDVAAWATTWPEEKLVRWGQPAEPCAPLGASTAAPSGNSGVAQGPPSVS